MQRYSSGAGYERYERRGQSAKWLISHAIEHPKEGLALDAYGNFKRKVVPIPEGHPFAGMWGTPKKYKASDGTKRTIYQGAVSSEKVWVRPVRQARCSWRIGDVHIHTSGANAHFSGLERCGSVWSCPVCAAVIRHRRAREIEAATTVHLKEVPGGLLFVTLTARHRKHQALADTLNAVLDGSTRLVQGRRWAGESDRAYQTRVDKHAQRVARYEAEHHTNKRLRKPKPLAPRRMGVREDYGILGTIRSTEVTAGMEFGWHPHSHLLIFTKRALTDKEIETLGDSIYDLWADVLEDATGLRPDREHGVKIERVDDSGEVVAQYLSKVQDQGKKWSVGSELARGDVKKGRVKNYSPYQLLDEDFPLPENEKYMLWTEFVEATAGRKAFSWSHGLKKHFEVDEMTDEEILDDTESEPVAYRVEPTGYDKVQKTDQGLLYVALELARRGRWKKVAEILPGEKVEESPPDEDDS